MEEARCSDMEEAFGLLGRAAHDACLVVVERMETDPAVRARVSARHTLMARAFAEEHPEASVEEARRAGRRAYLFALLIESGRVVLVDHDTDEASN